MGSAAVARAASTISRYSASDWARNIASTHLPIVPAVHERGGEQGCLTSLIRDHPPEPLEVLHALLGMRQDVHGILERHRSNALETTPHLDPEIIGLGGKVMNEEQPAPPV